MAVLLQIVPSSSPDVWTSSSEEQWCFALSTSGAGKPAPLLFAFCLVLRLPVVPRIVDDNVIEFRPRMPLRSVFIWKGLSVLR